MAKKKKIENNGLYELFGVKLPTKEELVQANIRGSYENLRGSTSNKSRSISPLSTRTSSSVNQTPASKILSGGSTSSENPFSLKNIDEKRKQRDAIENINSSTDSNLELAKYINDVQKNKVSVLGKKVGEETEKRGILNDFSKNDLGKATNIMFTNDNGNSRQLLNDTLFSSKFNNQFSDKIRVSENQKTTAERITGRKVKDINKKSDESDLQAILRTANENTKKRKELENTDLYKQYAKEKNTSLLTQYLYDIEKVNSEKTTKTDKINPFRAIKSGLTSALDVRDYVDENGQRVSLPTYSQLKTEKVMKDSGKLASAYQGAMTSAGQMIPAMAVSTIPYAGKALGLATTWVTTYNSAKNTKMLEGYSEKQAERYAGVNATLEAGLGGALGGLTKITGGKQSAFASNLQKVTDKFIVNKGASRFTAQALSELTEEELQNVFDPINEHVTLGKYDNLKEALGTLSLDEATSTALSTLMLVGLTEGATSKKVSNLQKEIDRVNKEYGTNLKFKNGSNEVTQDLSQNEQTVFDSIVENRKSELKEKNGKLSKKEISQIEKDVRQDLERGYLDTSEIERALSTDEWARHNEIVKQKDNIESRLNELKSKKMSDMTVDEYNNTNSEISSLQEQLDNIDTNTTREELNNSMMSKLSDNDTLLHKSFDTAYNFNEKFEQSAKAHNIDTNDDTIKTIKKKMLKRGISASFDEQTFSDSKEDAIWRQNADGTREVIFNPKADTGMLLQNVAVHEMYHDVFSSKTGQKLNQEVLDYVKSKDGYEEARKELEQVYAKDYDINSEEFTKKIDEEVVAKTLGQKLGDQEYINSLTIEKPSTARAIYNWVVDKLNKFTGSRNEKLFWTDVKNKFETALSEDYVTRESSTAMMLNKESENIEKTIKIRYNSIDEAIKNDPRKASYKKYSTSLEFFNLEYDEMRKAIAIGSKASLEAQNMGLDEYSFNDDNYIYDFDIIDKTNNAFGITHVEAIKNISEEVYNERSSRENSGLSKEQYRLQEERNNNDNKSIRNRGTSEATSELDTRTKTNELVSNEKTGINDNKELDNSSFSLDKLPKVKDGYTRLYRGLNNDYDVNYDRSTLDSPNGYDTLTDNYELAKQYGKNVYYIDIPTNQIADSVIDENPNSETYGDRNLAYKDDKPAGLNGVSGDEYLLYTDHDDFDSNNYHKVEDSNTNNSISNKDSQGRTLTKEQQEYFKDSKAVDKDGKLVTVYHGSKKAGFTTFNTKDNVSFYTDNNNVANTYSGSNEMVDTRKLESVSDAKSWLKGINDELYIDKNNVYDYDGEIVLEYENQNELLRHLKRDIQKEIGNIEAGGIYKGYVNITNPYIVETQGKNWNNITIGQNDNVEKMYNSLSFQEKEYLSDLADKMDDSYDNYNDALEGFYQRLNANNEALYDKVTLENSIRQKLYDTALYSWNDTYVEDLIGKRYNTNDIVKQVLEENKNGKNYDGVIFKNIVDEGMFDSGTKKSTTSNVYVTFNPNQFKAFDNNTPTNEADIRYSTTTDKFQKFLDKNIQRGKGKTIQEVTKQQDKAVKKAIAPLNKEIKSLKKEISDLQENASITQKEFEEQYKKIAPLLNEQVVPPEIESTPSIKDTSKMNKKDLKALSKNMKEQLGLTNKQKLELEDIIQEYSTSETATRNDLFRDIKDRFGKESITTEFEDIKNIQNELKNTKLDVSQNIKNDITDYNKLKQRNFGKIRFNRDGLPVDVVYQDLSSKYPNYFPSNIFNESDQFNKIVEVANLENKSVEEYNIDDDYLRETSDFIYDSIEESKQDILKKLSEKERTKHLKSLLKDNNIIAPIKDWEPYIQMRNEINNGGYEIVETNNPTKLESYEMANNKAMPKESNLIKFQEAFTNRNAYIDRLSKEVNNKNIKILADHVNNMQGEIETNINRAQTNSRGKPIGKSVSTIFNQARGENLSESFNDYLFHLSNIERHNAGKGSQIPSVESEYLVKEYEKEYPQMKKWAEEVNQYNKNLLYRQADAGLISKEFADNLSNKYKFYVPFFENVESEYVPDNNGKIKTKSTVKGAEGGANKNLLPFEEAMVRQTNQAISNIRKNDLYLEIMKSMNKKGIGVENNTDPDNVVGVSKDNSKFTLSAYQDGIMYQTEINKTLYDELNQTFDKGIKNFEKRLSFVFNPVQKANNIRRNVLTTWSPSFIATNFAKDLQDAMLNSRYTKDFAKNYPKALKELTTGKGVHVEEFLNMYGKANILGNYSLDSGAMDVTKLVDTKGKSNSKLIEALKKIPQANEIIEMAPRYTEYLSSIEHGCSQMEALYNAREVTVNFGRGGSVTRFLNRNGFTFFNASVQGLSKFGRNFSENGAKAIFNTGLKAVSLGIAPALFNAMLFDDDDDYKDIPDYIKNNYYLIRTSSKDGKSSFIRIPKGRMLSIFGSATTLTKERIEGKRNNTSIEQDLKAWFDNAWNQVGVADPGSNNLVAPIIQAKNNKTWYGTEMVPSRLLTKKDGTKTPENEQYDASTDKFSIWLANTKLGKKLNINPYKANYIIDQYSGGIGDMILPTITEEAQSNSNSVIGKAIAPLKDKFTADSVTDNKNVTNFYSKVEELGAKKNETGSKKDDIKYQYMKNLSFEMGSLYKEMREVQADKKMSDSKKYAKVQSIKAEINKLAKEGMNGYNDVELYDNYARVGDRELYKYKNSKGEIGWSLSDSKYADNIKKLGLSVKEKNDYYTTKMKMSDVASQYGENDGSKRYRAVIKTIRKSGLSSDAKYQLFNSWYGKNDKSSSVAQDVGISADDYLKYKTADLSADKNKNGYSIRGSKANKVINFLNKKTNLNKGQKAILYRMSFGYKGNYNSTNYSNKYNSAIVKYVNTLDTTYEEDENIYKTLGFKVDKKGNIWW